MRRLACFGIVTFAFSLTMGVIMWMKSIQHQWYSTMYGVYYFAGSVWMTLATVYVLTMIFKRQGYLKGVVFEKQFYFIGTLFFAFTVFYAYIHFSQFFIIWNANIPEETFWYYIRTNPDTKGDERWMRVIVEPGDLLVVPKGKHHRFELTAAKTIRCVLQCCPIQRVSD